MLLRELVGGDPPYTCKLLFRDDPGGFGHRLTDGGRVVEHVLTQMEEFQRAVAAKIAEGFPETGRSLTRRVFVTADRFWIVALDADTLRTQSGGRGANWRESSGQTKGKVFRDRDRAVAAYRKAIADKQADGYHEQYARTVAIADTPKAPKQPGKRKSR